MGVERYLIGLLAFLILFTAFPSFAQDETRGRSEEEGSRYKVPDSLAKKPDPDRILLVPYEPNRYNNELEKEMKEETGLRLRQIRKRIRFGLDNMLLDRLQKDREVVSYMRENDPDRNFELKYVYRGLAYKYRTVPEKDLRALEGEEEDKEGFLKRLFGGSEEEAEKDTGAGRDVMSEGQIKDRPDDRIRYMDAMFRRSGILEYLTRRYGVGRLLFINQLDLHPKKDAPTRLAAGTHDNLIKVHFTIMDHKGRTIHGGAAFVSFPSEVKDLNGLIKGYFPKVADHVADRLEEGR
jgi:hypothetical protein